MAAPQDWAPYYGLAAKVYLRDPVVALDQLRGVVDFPSIQSFFMSRRLSEESWGEALSQEVDLTDGRRLIMWRADETCRWAKRLSDRCSTLRCGRSCCRRSPNTSWRPNSRS